MALQDLSQPLAPNIPVPTGFPSPRFESFRRVGPHRSNITEYTFVSHVGTHMDAPLHYYAERAALDEIDVNRFRGRGFVLPIRRPRLSRVTPEDLRPYQDEIRGLPFLLLSFGWARHFGSAEYFNHPFLSEDAAQEIVDLGIGCIAIDILTPDAALPVRPDNHTGPVHRILLGNDVLIVENAASMGLLENRHVEVTAFPVAIERSDGAPVRLVAEAVDELQPA